MSTLQIDCLAHSKDVVIHCDWSEKLLDYITLMCVLTPLWMVVIWTGFKGGSMAFEPGTNILHSIHGTFVWSILQKHSNWDVRRAFKTFFSAPYQKNKKNIFCFCRGKKWFSFSKMRNFVHLPRDKLLQVKRGERRGRKGAKVLVHSSEQWFTAIAPVNKKVPPSFYQVPYQ